MATVLDAPEEAVAEGPWKVVAQTGRVGRKHFEGLEKDAREFVTKNFPRPHVDEFTADPNSPVHDVKLVAPDGSEEVFNSHDGWSANPHGGN
jgi:hypothetical protein